MSKGTGPDPTDDGVRRLPLGRCEEGPRQPGDARLRDFEPTSPERKPFKEFDPIKSMMARYPALTREEAEAVADDFGL